MQNNKTKKHTLTNGIKIFKTIKNGNIVEEVFFPNDIPELDKPRFTLIRPINGDNQKATKFIKNKHRNWNYGNRYVEFVADPTLFGQLEAHQFSVVL